LSAPGLLQAIRENFAQIADTRPGCEIAQVDALMSGLAVFGLKYPSLLKFDEAYSGEAVIRANLKSLYGVKRAPCDTQLRTRLDTVEPEQLRPAFGAMHRYLQRHKALEAYEYLDGYYLVSLDGTGQCASSAISCPQCCVKRSGQANESYYHQLLAAVIVHPELKTVLPLMPEAITRQDGVSKNDCERNASKRLLTALRQDHPKLKLIIVEDSLASNGPHLELIESLGMRYIIGVKSGDHESLFAQVQTKLCAGECQEWESTDAQGVEHGYRWVNGLALNQSHLNLKVNFLEYWEIENGQERIWSWVTNIMLTPDNVEAVMRGGRARWKVENETFNTLKNQGYGLEHNYGHGPHYLATVFALLMMLAFLVDQAQELSCRLFQAARDRFHARTALWERLRALFTDFYIPDWKTLWQVLAIGHTATLLTSQAPDTS
jgi:hypothetical protein